MESVVCVSSDGKGKVVNAPEVNSEDESCSYGVCAMITDNRFFNFPFCEYFFPDSSEVFMSETSDESGSINSANKSENDNRGEKNRNLFYIFAQIVDISF